MDVTILNVKKPLQQKVWIKLHAFVASAARMTNSWTKTRGLRCNSGLRLRAVSWTEANWVDFTELRRRLAASLCFVDELYRHGAVVDRHGGGWLDEHFRDWFHLVHCFSCSLALSVHAEADEQQQHDEHQWAGDDHHFEPARPSAMAACRPGKISKIRSISSLILVHKGYTQAVRLIWCCGEQCSFIISKRAPELTF